MIEILRQHIISRLGIDTDNLDKVLDQFKPLQLKRNEYLLHEGEVCKHVYFIAKGCLQVFVYDSDMNETTRDIVTEGNWCSELLSFGSGGSATENIRAVEPCELLAIDKKSFQTMMDQSHSLIRFTNRSWKHHTQTPFIVSILLLPFLLWTELNG